MTGGDIFDFIVYFGMAIYNLIKYILSGITQVQKAREGWNGDGEEVE